MTSEGWIHRAGVGAALAVLLLAGAACGGDDTTDATGDVDAITTTTAEATEPAAEEADETPATSSQYGELDADNQQFMDRICTGARDPSTYRGDIALDYNLVRSGERGVSELDEAWQDLDSNDRDALLAAAGPVCDAVGWAPGA